MGMRGTSPRFLKTIAKSLLLTIGASHIFIQPEAYEGQYILVYVRISLCQELRVYAVILSYVVKSAEMSRTSVEPAQQHVHANKRRREHLELTLEARLRRQLRDQLVAHQHTHLLQQCYTVTSYNCYEYLFQSHIAGVSRLFCPKSHIIWELKIAQYKMYTNILAQGANLAPEPRSGQPCHNYIYKLKHTLL